MKKILSFYAWVLGDVDMLISLSQQLFVESSGFAFVTDVKYERLPHFFFSFSKVIGCLICL